MSTRYVFYALILVVAAIMIWIISETVTQPGISDLEGEFEELAFYRNENNTGPIVRIYAVYASDTLWDQMKSYGEFMPHTKYGNTRVYFFNSKKNAPNALRSNEPNFDEVYNSSCIGFYEKSSMGQERFVKYPFR
ncbi:hypothetical protein [Fontibacter flavus]|uniref:Uncharacterized protein n=1 Tax=Fontibacter flavus TaxID=654838 RepID=A0ABV6FVZ7_9BACT